MIAALFVATGGTYYGLDGVDPWDQKRDARLYDGPHPVVAHPPCQLWVNFAYLNFSKYGGERNRPGNDGGCFASALANVRRCGGVLEHPAGSRAWAKYDLLQPHPSGWTRSFAGEWTCEVWQSAYGHLAQKRTWLFYVGATPPELNWAHIEGTHQVGGFDIRKPVLSKKQSSATPPAFRDMLLDIARSARAQAAD